MQSADQPHSQRGAMMIMTGMLIVVIFLIAAFVIEFLRYQMILRSAQRTVDAAALAGALELGWPPPGWFRGSQPDPQDPEDPPLLEEWRKAKRAVFAGLQMNAIEGVGFQTGSLTPAEATNLPERSTDSCVPSFPEFEEPAPGAQEYSDRRYGCINYDFSPAGSPARVSVTIRRGVYFTDRADGASGAPEFKPRFLPLDGFDQSRGRAWRTLEEAAAAQGVQIGDTGVVNSQGVRTTGDPNANFERSCAFNRQADDPTQFGASFDIYQIANALELEMVIQNVPTFIGRAFGALELPDIRITSLASTEVLPLSNCCNEARLRPGAPPEPQGCVPRDHLDGDGDRLGREILPPPRP